MEALCRPPSEFSIYNVYLGIALQHLQCGSMKRDHSCLCYIPVVKALHQYSGHCQSELVLIRFQSVHDRMLQNLSNKDKEMKII